MIKIESFIEEVLDDYKLNLKSYGIDISKSHSNDIEVLIKALCNGLYGNLEQKFYINSLPPGFGKTEAISSLIRVWKRNAFNPRRGILVAFKTLDEIKALINRAGLKERDFACLTADEELNRLGRCDINKSPILFTTHAMMKERCKKRKFSSVSDFKFEGRVRELRVWDEAFLLSTPASTTLYHLRSLPLRLDPFFGNFAKEVSAFADLVSKTAFGVALPIPRHFADLASPVRARMAAGKFSLPEEDRRTLENLVDLAGRAAMVRSTGGKSGGEHDDGGNRAIVGSSAPLPADLAPAIITDASASFHENYRIMAAATGQVEFLPCTGADYERVKFHIWSRACGKAELEHPTRNRDIFKHAAEVMERKTGPWLVISYKAKGALDVKAALEDTLGGAVPFEFCHWGKHHGTNAFKHIKNVMVIGQFLYRHPDYEALGTAASGMPVDKVPVFKTADVRRAEIKHNLYQAICRGNVRNVTNGCAGECDVYIVSPPSIKIQPLLETAFPGAAFKEWGAKRVVQIGKNQRAVIETIKRLMPPSVSRIQKKDVFKAAALASSSELARQLKHPVVKDFLDSEGLEPKGQIIFRR